MKRVVRVCGGMLMTALLLGCERGTVDPCTSGTPPPIPTGIMITPGSLQLAPGARGTLSAQVIGLDPRCVDFALTVRWRVHDTAVARVEVNTGATTTVLGRAPGSTQVIAVLVADPTFASAAPVQVSGN